MRVLITIISILAIGYLGICAWLYFRQSSLVFFPYRTLEATPESFGMPYEDVRVESSDNTMLHGWLVLADSSLGTILFCHGNGGNISHRLDLISLWRSMGYDVLGFDYQGYGQSEGSPSEEATYADVRAYWDYLTAVRSVDPKKIILLGRSLGGAVASHLVAELSQAGLPTPSGLVLEAPFTSVPEMGARLYPFLPVGLLSRISYDNRANLANIHIPTLFFHGRDDTIVPLDMGREVFEAANQPKRFVELPGGHEDTYLVAEKLYKAALTDFADSVLSVN
jgi:uncharacterized protein